MRKKNKKLWVWDDGGRAEAGFEGPTGDCLIRAFSIAMQVRYGWEPEYAYNRMMQMILVVDAEYRQKYGVKLEDTDTSHLRIQGQFPFGLWGDESLAEMLSYEAVKIPRDYRPSWEELLGVCKGLTVMVYMKGHISTIVKGQYRDTLNLLDPAEKANRPQVLYVADTDAEALRHRIKLLAKKARLLKKMM